MKDLEKEQELPADYPSEYIEYCSLRDATQVLVRPIRPDDARRLQEGMQRLSAQSIYMRFLEAQKELTDIQAQTLATVDYLQRMALVASVEVDGDEELIGVARYSVLPDRPGSAEVAIVIGDEFQGRGCGSLLLDRLVRYALAHGVDTFVATVHISNARILNFVKRSPFKFEKMILEPGVWELRILINQLREN